MRIKTFKIIIDQHSNTYELEINNIVLLLEKVSNSPFFITNNKIIELKLKSISIDYFMERPYCREEPQPPVKINYKSFLGIIPAGQEEYRDVHDYRYREELKEYEKDYKKYEKDYKKYKNFYEKHKNKFLNTNFFCCENEIFMMEEANNHNNDEIELYIKEHIYKKDKKLEKLKKEIELIEKAEKNTEKTREPLPEEVKFEVWRRDQGKCVNCGSKENLEFDHIIPFSKGGSNSARNLQLLCEKCNRSKSNKI